MRVVLTQPTEYLSGLFMKYGFVFFCLLISSSLIGAPARRIITLAPNLTEIVFAAGAGDRLVGVSSFSDYPKEAKKIPIVASYQSIDLERVVALHPDLVIAWQYTNALMIKQLQQLHFSIYRASFSRLSDIPKTIEAIGQLAGTRKQADQSAAHFRKALKHLKDQYKNKKPVTVFYQLSQHPLITINQHALTNRVIQLCGGKNIFENTLGLAPTVSIENILKQNPQLIFISAFQSNKSPLKFWQAYPQLLAVKKGHLYSVDASLVERAGPRILQGISQICRDINQARVG